MKAYLLIIVTLLLCSCKPEQQQSQPNGGKMYPNVKRPNLDEIFNPKLTAAQKAKDEAARLRRSIKTHIDSESY